MRSALPSDISRSLDHFAAVYSDSSTETFPSQSFFQTALVLAVLDILLFPVAISTHLLPSEALAGITILVTMTVFVLIHLGVRLDVAYLTIETSEVQPAPPPSGVPLDQTAAPVHYEGDTKSV